MPTIFESEDEELKDSKKGSLKKTTKKISKTEETQVLKDFQTKDKHSLPGHTHNPFAAYCYYPDKVNFANKDPQERVILLLRRHPITNVGWLTVAFIMITAPSFLSVFSPFELLPPNYQFMLTLVWYLITSAFILEQFLSWFFNVNIVTDERVVDVDFVSLVYREMSDANIDHIEDVTVEVGGTLRTFLHYGDVVIQTAAEVPRITFEAIPNPDKVARVLRDLRIEEETEKLEGRIR